VSTYGYDSLRRHPEAAVRREMRAIIRRRRELTLWQKAAAWTLFYAAIFVAGSIVAAHMPMRLDFPIDHGTQISKEVHGGR
jgi:hypothetical protein